MRCLGCLGATTLVLWGCGDQVVGQFNDTVAQDTGAAQTSSTSAADSAGETQPQGSEDSGGPWQGGCFADDFDGATLDEYLWNSWVDPGASWTQTAGVLRFIPAPTGLYYTGITGSWRYNFPFHDAEISMKLATAPSATAPVNVYLQLLQEPFVLSIMYGRGAIEVSITDGSGPQPSKIFPSPEAPRALRIRGEGDVVHFESSVDGGVWTTLSTQAQPTVLQAARALVMVETTDDYPEQAPVELERFDACATF